ncbi:MAG: restriction endonuclease [Rhizobacter sp.]|nr:restriction endonuclease [Rhizobacter sp.]
MFFGKSPFAAGLRVLAPFGWFMLVTGCALLWWQLSSWRTKNIRASRPTPTSPPAPFRRSSSAPPPVDRVPTEDDRLAAEPKPHTVGPRSTPTTWGPGVFSVIEWRRFEALVEALFAQAGFDTKSQSHGADEGIDIWLFSKTQPGTPVSIVQCKHWQGKQVGVDKVRELRGVMAAKSVTRGQFATTSSFTSDATSFAKDNGINLLDFQGLLSLIAQRTPEQQQALLAVALEGEHWRPTCVNCGIKMVQRSPRKGGAAFWGCEGFPKCKTTMPMRGALVDV